MSYMGMSGRLLSLLVSIGSVAAIGLVSPKLSVAQKRHPPNIILVSPKAGDVLTPGDQVTISWEIDAPATENLQGCEQEIYLSTDRGRTIAVRLTPEFSYSVTSYTMTVPNLPAKKAVIVMGFGCEGGTPIFESQYPQKQSVFKINKAPAGLEDVTVTAARQTTGASGTEVSLSWDSTVRNVDHFEIQMSRDQGAHFQTIGLASEQSFRWQMPEGLSGETTFRVIAHRGDGTSLESLMTPAQKTTSSTPNTAPSSTSPKSSKPSGPNSSATTQAPTCPSKAPGSFFPSSLS